MRRFVPRALLTAAAMVTAAACASSGGGGGVSLGGDTGGRYLVMIPALEGPEGDRVAADLRTLLTDNMATHVAINDRDVRQSMEQYGVEELSDITARQLGAQIGAQIVTWGQIAPGGAGLEADLRIIDTRSGDEITISDVTGANSSELASSLYAEFDQAMEGVRQAAFCNDHLSSNNYAQALETCERALAIVPTSSPAIYGKATALLNLERYDEALVEYNRLLEQDATHQDGLLGAGYAASNLDRSEEAMGYYRRYMEVNPGNVQVRMSIAYDIGQTGDYVSAYRLLEPVVSDNADDVEFQQFLFSIATEAGRRLNQAGDSAQARPIFESALAAYQAGYSNGEELEATTLSQAIAVNNALGRADEAMRMAEDATQRFPDNPQMWDQLARVHTQAERYDQAIQAFDRVASLDPEFPDLYIRRGQARLQAGQRQQALADFQRAADAGDRQRVATILLAQGANAARASQWEDAAASLAAAHPYSEGETRSQVEYLWGASLAQQANALARSNVEAANAQVMERVLDMSRRSADLLRSSGHPSAGQTLSSVEQLIANQEALLQSLRR